MQVSELAIERISASNKCKHALGYEFDVGYKTIENWLESRDIRLTTPLAISIIKKELGLKDEEILYDSKVPA